MVAAYWQQPLLQADVAHWLGTRGVGTPSSRIQRLTKRGFEANCGTGSLAELESWIAQGVPCVLFVRTGELPYWQIDTSHAVVLAGLEANRAYWVGPAVETVLVTVLSGDLMLVWSYSEYTYAVLHVSVS
jgi:hypothetical protein